MSNRNIPKIRFKEFINKWNNYKLGQLGNFKSGIGFPDSQQGGTEGIPFFKVSDMNNIGNETEMRNANNYVTQEQIMKNSWKVIDETPAIIFAKVGAALMLNRKRLVTRPFLIDNNTMSYSFDESWDKDFGLTLFQTINLPKYAQIGALPSYNASDIAMIKVNVPNVQEQSAIGSLFRTLDDLLSSYKDNLANYQSLKATMLSKMFPKAGQSVPEIRLDGFEGEWRIIKLGDVLSELKSGLSRELSNDDIGLPVIRANNISDGNLNLDRDIKYWFKEDPKGANTANYFVKENDILVNFINSEAKMGTAAIVLREPDRETIYTTNILKLTVKEDYYPYFIYLMTFVQSYQNYIKSITKPAVNQASFTTVDFKKYEFLCPAFQEQQSIGTYFSNLDSLIVAHQEKISQLETLKKKLLQNMFI